MSDKGRHKPNPEEITSLEECDNEITNTQLRMVEIQDQIRRARADWLDHGKHTASSWFARAQTALQHAKRRVQALQLRRGQLRREINIRESAKRDVCFERHFFTAVKRILPQDVFERLVAEAAQAAEQPESNNERAQE